MGPGLDRSRCQGPGREDALERVRVHDVIDLKASYGLDHEPGVVLILDSFVVEAPESLVGKPARVLTPSGRDWDVTIDAVREHGVTISLFVKNLTSQDLPIGSIVELDCG